MIERKYIVHFKGDMESIEVNEERANKLKEMLGEGKMTTFVEIGESMFQVSAIKSIVPAQSRRSDRETVVEPPLTPEEHQHRIQTIKRMREEMEAKGILKKKNT